MPVQEIETIKVLERALNVLGELRKEKGPIGVNDLAKRCGLNLSTVFRVVKTLEASGWVHQLSDDKYIPGQKFFFETERSNFYLALRDVAYPIMCRRTAQEGQAMNLCVRNGDKCTVLEQSRTERLVDIVPPRGADLPIYATGGGKVLFSELPEPLLESILDNTEYRRFTSHTITSRQALLQELARTRDNGYGVDLFESVEGTSCIAVPVRGPEGDIVAALSFSGFIGAASDEAYLVGLLPVLRSAAEEILEKLFTVYEDAAGMFQCVKM